MSTCKSWGVNGRTVRYTSPVHVEISTAPWAIWLGKDFLLLLLVFCCSSRSMTPITETHHRHLSSARFFAVSYPSHMLLTSCSLFLPLVRFPFILPSRTSRSNTSCRRTCPSHLHFRWFIVLMIQRFSLTRFTLTLLYTTIKQISLANWMNRDRGWIEEAVACKAASKATLCIES